MSKLDDLRNFLSMLPSGRVVEVGKVEGLLNKAWNELTGSDSGGMQAYKLIERVEKPIWNPPVLEFQIEWHGGTVMGSVYAGLQTWRIDVQKGVAEFAEHPRGRLVGERAEPLKVEPLVGEIETLVREGKEDLRLKWLSTNCVRVQISEVIPATNKQTTSERRKRFIKALEERLKVAGWHKVPKKLNTFAL